MLTHVVSAACGLVGGSVVPDLEIWKAFLFDVLFEISAQTKSSYIFLAVRISDFRVLLDRLQQTQVNDPLLI